MDKKQILYLLPVVLCLSLIVVASIPLLRGNNPADIRSVLINQTVPDFSRAEFGSNDLKGHVTLVNFFASWCPPCEAEHPLLIDLKTRHGVLIYGIDYKDSDSGRLDYLQRLGNPYAAIAPDPKGELAILWGTYGVPETFLIDKEGRIRYRLTAPLTPDFIDNTILPMIRSLQ